ncbi:helix-turn-helix domain-containing protein [Paenibacillus durus]|uniref:helix-turn-helix domain-containing protein n=1 Tax=Paenibacillus durus TaxID=44251 RepID=UPI000693AF1C|nr:AraC family transcriptional regulator [Paenibacillus durus]
MNQPLYIPVQAHSPYMSISGRYCEWKPSHKLRKYIYCYWVSPFTNHPKPECQLTDNIEMIVPDGCIDMVFRIDRTLPDIQNLVVGTTDRAIFVDMEYDRIDTFGIRFYPGGLQPFIKEPSYLFTNQIINFEDVIKGFSSELKEQLYLSPSFNNTVYSINKYLLSKLSNDLGWEDTFQNALMHIYQANGNLSVKEIARKEVISEKQLTRIFYERAGVGTKTFLRIMRLQQLLTILHGREKTTLTDAAIQSGYYDQAHCIREFQDFCGILPSDYIKFRN